MANTVKCQGTSVVASAATTVYTTPALTAGVILSLTVCNTFSTAITVSVTVYKGGATPFYLTYQMSIAQNATLVAIGEGQKVTLQAADILKVQIHTASGTADVVVSVMEVA